MHKKSMPYPKLVNHGSRSFPVARAIGGLVVLPFGGYLPLAAGEQSVEARPKLPNKSSNQAVRVSGPLNIRPIAA